MKKVIIGLLLVGLVLVVFGCGKATTKDTSQTVEDGEVNDLGNDLDGLDSTGDDLGDLNNVDSELNEFNEILN